MSVDASIRSANGHFTWSFFFFCRGGSGGSEAHEGNTSKKSHLHIPTPSIAFGLLAATLGIGKRFAFGKGPGP